MFRHLLFDLAILLFSSFALLAQKELSSAPNFYVGSPAVVVASGDFNGDGITDVAVVQSHGTAQATILIMLGNGDGSFRKGQTIQGTGMFIAVADFTGDRKLDIIAGCGPSLNLYRGNSDGAFQNPTSISAPSSACVSATADVNGDQKLDLVLSDLVSSMTVLLGNGDGTFQAPITFSTTIPARVVVADDVNNDQKPDLVISNASDQVVVLLGKGDGTFTESADLSINDSISLATGDFNNDGSK